MKNLNKIEKMVPNVFVEKITQSRPAHTPQILSKGFKWVVYVSFITEKHGLLAHILYHYFIMQFTPHFHSFHTINS